MSLINTVGQWSQCAWRGHHRLYLLVRFLRRACRHIAIQFIYNSINRPYQRWSHSVWPKLQRRYVGLMPYGDRQTRGRHDSSEENCFCSWFCRKKLYQKFDGNFIFCFFYLLLFDASAGVSLVPGSVSFSTVSGHLWNCSCARARIWAGVTRDKLSPGIKLYLKSDLLPLLTRLCARKIQRDFNEKLELETCSWCGFI